MGEVTLVMYKGWNVLGMFHFL